MRIYQLLLALAMGALAANACAQDEPGSAGAPPGDAGDPRARLDEKVPHWLEAYDVPSAAIAYIEDGELAWTAVYGKQSPGVEATTDTLYNIASMTKPLVSETLLRLASEGRVSLDEPMSEHWIDPDIADNPWHELLTPELAITHQTGFPNWRYQTDDELKFLWKPGTKTGYSGEGFDYVARFLEEKLDKSLNDIVKDTLFEPVGMTSTAFTRKDWFEGRLALSQDAEGEMRQPDISNPWSAADNVYTTIGDYARFVVAVMSDEEVDDRFAESRYTVRDNQIANGCPVPPEHCPEEIGVGLGWQVFVYEDETVVQHGGADWGEKALGFFIPETGKGVIVFTNGANGFKVIHDIVGVLHDNDAYQAFLAMQAGRDG